jgi:hypothetical protein
MQGVVLVALAAVAGTAAAQVTPSDRWSTRVTLYGFFPSVHAKANFEVPGNGSISTERDPDTYLTNLQSTFMGAFEFRKHPWSVQGDFIYLNFGDLKSKITNISDVGGSGVDLAVQSTTSTDLKGGLAQLAAGFCIANTETNTLDAIAGVRYLRLKAGLDWEFSGPVGTFPLAGNVEKTKDIVDGVRRLPRPLHRRQRQVVRAVVFRRRDRDLALHLPGGGRRRLPLRLGRRERHLPPPAIQVRQRLRREGADVQRADGRRYVPLLTRRRHAAKPSSTESSSSAAGASAGIAAACSWTLDTSERFALGGRACDVVHGRHQIDGCKRRSETCRVVLDEDGNSRDPVLHRTGVDHW